MLVYLVVLVCALFLGWMVYRYDLYEKEPWYLLLFVMVLGYILFWGLGYLEDFTNKRLGFYGPGDHTAGQALVAASHEELAKLLAVVVAALLFRRHFNDPMDGLIYGAFAGLGMALEESLFYIQVSFAAAVGVESDLDLIGREAVRLLLHILMGGITGFGVGLTVAHTRMRWWFAVLVGWVAASMTIHFLWDFLCGIPSASPQGVEAAPEVELLRRAAAVVLMLAAMGYFGWSVVLGSRMSREKFAPTSEKRLGRWSLFH